MSGGKKPGVAPSRREALRLGASAVGMAVLTVCAPLGLAGCGSDAEGDAQAVRDSIDSELTQLKTLSASELLGDTLSSIEKLGISGDDFLGAFLDGCSWEIGDVAVSGSAATAQVALTCRSMASALDALNDAYTSQTLEDGGHPSESSLYATAGKAFIDCVHATALGERSAEVTLAKHDGTWLIDDAGRATLISAFLGS